MGIDTNRIGRKEGELYVNIFEKRNKWGCFLAISTQFHFKPQLFIILPGGRTGEIWKSFAIWMGEEIDLVSGNLGIIPVTRAAEQSTIPKSYIDAVRGSVPVPAVTTIHHEILALQRQVDVLLLSVQRLEDRREEEAAAPSTCPNSRHDRVSRADVNRNETGRVGPHLVDILNGPCEIMDAGPSLVRPLSYGLVTQV